MIRTNESTIRLGIAVVGVVVGVLASKAIAAAQADKRAKKAEQKLLAEKKRDLQISKKTIWECEVDGCWLPYPPDVSTILEKSFIDKKNVNFALHGKNYEVDVTSLAMQQKNTRTQYRRPVRRREEQNRIAAPRITWECNVDGNWIDYEDALAIELESHYRQGRKELTFSVSDTLCKIDFQSDILEQVDIESGHRRPVRRRQDLSTTSFPTTWSENKPGQNCELVPVSYNSFEWKMVEDSLLATIPGAQIMEILRVQNIHLWEYFCFRKKRIAKLSEKKCPNLKRVWHGTRNNDPKLICRDRADGFMMQHSRAGMWGQGIYFAEKASYSHDYAHNQGTCYSLILANLVVGEEVALPSDKSLRHCPTKPDGNERYDTVVGSTNGSKVFIVYENGRAYPEYVVNYSY